MDLDELIETKVWELYQKHVDFMHLRGIYTDTDVNYRMYNGDQWHGAKLGNIEKIQYNFIKSIVKHKVSTITSNLFAVNYSPENLETSEFYEMAEKACELLNKRASKVFDNDYLDRKIKKWCKQSAINDEAVCYVYYNEDDDMPVNEVIAKNDIMYGNENDNEIQFQPYILLRQRKTILELRELARKNGVSEEEIEGIVGDNDTSTASGDSAKDELEDKTWLITKFYKKNGTVHYQQATRYCDIAKDKDTKLSLYPIAHFNWEDQEGNARGIGEVRQLIPNQLEANKTAMRRALSVKNTAYPQKVVNVDSVVNKKDVNKIGSTIEFHDMGNTKASDIFMNTIPAQMSSDSEKLQTELITYSRELNNAGDTTVGNIDPSKSSGRAILAVQQAQNQPLNDQVIELESFIEELARIWLEMWQKYAKKGLIIETDEMNPMTGLEETIRVKVPSSVLRRLKASIKVDITPHSAFDKYAREMSMENLLTNGQITFEEWVKSMDNNSSYDKNKLLKIIADRKRAQQQINDMRLRGQEMLNEAEQQQQIAGDISAISTSGYDKINEVMANQEQQVAPSLSSSQEAQSRIGAQA